MPDPFHRDADVREWLPLAYWIARDFHLPGADREDVRQEAAIALWHALSAYDGSGSLRGWLAVCVRRRLVSALRSATAGKHRVLNTALSELEGVCPSRATASTESVSGRSSSSLSALLAPLSPNEQSAALRYAYGYTAAELGIDGQRALWRARAKLRKLDAMSA